MQIEIPHTDDEQVGDDEVRKPPEHVDGRGRKTFARRFGERALKGPPHHAADEMRNGGREKSSTEEVRHVVKPIRPPLTSTPQTRQERPQAWSGAPYSSSASCCAGPCPRAPGRWKTIDPARPGSVRHDSSAGWSIAAMGLPVSLPEGTRCCFSIPTGSVPSPDHAIDTRTAAARRWCSEAAMSRRRCLPRDLY